MKPGVLGDVVGAQDVLGTDGARQRMRGAGSSQRVVALMGVPSVAEAAALAAGGATARLLVSRIAIGPATCALATTGGAL